MSFALIKSWKKREEPSLREGEYCPSLSSEHIKFSYASLFY